jgi:hypothetical protein
VAPGRSYFQRSTSLRLAPHVREVKGGIGPAFE